MSSRNLGRKLASAEMLGAGERLSLPIGPSARGAFSSRGRCTAHVALALAASSVSFPGERSSLL